MSAPRGGLEARLRRHFAGVDTAPDFPARLAARISVLPARSVELLRTRAERQHAETLRRLRREAWTNLATAAGIGAAAVTVVWRHGSVVAETVEGWFTAFAQPDLLGGVAVAALAASLWPVLQRYLPR